MNNGWVQKRRGVLDHLQGGRLTPVEYTILDVLILLADSSTGGYRINAGGVQYFTGGAIQLRTAQRALRTLSEKGYIWYRPTRDPHVQPYFVNRYLLTTGPKGGCKLDLSSLRDNDSVTVPEVLAHAVAASDIDTTPSSHRHHIDTTPSLVTEVGANLCRSTVPTSVDKTTRDNENDKEKDNNTPSSQLLCGSTEPGWDGMGGLGCTGTSSLSGQETISPEQPTAEPLTTTVPRPAPQPAAPPGFIPTYRSGTSPAIVIASAQRPTPASDAAARMSNSYLSRVSNLKRHAAAAESSWPTIFERMLAAHTEADLTAAIEWAWNESDFWPDKLDRFSGDPTEYLSEHVDSVVAAWRRDMRSSARKVATTVKAEEVDETLGGLLNFG